jgi:hypothetical protein
VITGEAIAASLREFGSMQQSCARRAELPANFAEFFQLLFSAG